VLREGNAGSDTTLLVTLLEFTELMVRWVKKRKVVFLLVEPVMRVAREIGEGLGVFILQVEKWEVKDKSHCNISSIGLLSRGSLILLHRSIYLFLFGIEIEV